jgi:hypothetical protein
MAPNEEPNWESCFFADESRGRRVAFLRPLEIGSEFLVDCSHFDNDSGCKDSTVYVEGSPEDVVVTATGGAFCLMQRMSCTAIG